MTTQPTTFTEQTRSAGVQASRVEYLHGCPVCGHDDLRHYCRVPSLFNAGEFIRYERCTACGTALRNPRLPTDYRLSRYEDKVMTDAQKQLNPKLQMHYRFMMKIILGLLPENAGRRLLDFGCGAGGFLVEAREAGFDVTGLEINRDLAAHVENVLGIPCHRGLISDPAFSDQRFNVVVTSQVFEHLTDPRQTLMELRRHLLPSAVVLVEVPNLLDSRERIRRGSLMDDSHLFYFTASSLSGLFRTCGLRVLKVQQGLRPYRFLPETASLSPVTMYEMGERILSFLRIRTGLGVVGRLDDES